ncbi:MAG TPA: agmatinase [Solirubrobacteraceae bacterium]|nr:agmatinase [Solirubrobacteraceae bacterium]
MSSARDAPRYTGIRTFAGLPHVPLGEHAATGDAATGQLAARSAATGEVAIVGIPFDTATSYRPGARFGPEAVRSASVLLRPWHPLHGVDVFGSQQVLDRGDIAITPGNALRSAEQIAAALTPLCTAGVTPLVIGGDHSIALGELRAHAVAHGPLALVLLDAHADTWNDYYGEQLFHGTPFRRAVEEGLVDPARSLMAGIRGSLYGPEDLPQARELGFELLPIDELRATNPADFAARVRARVGDAPVFLGFDIDVIDPSAAPGTGTPEVGGLLAAEALALLRALADVRFVGFDVVEVSPPYDSAGQITALLAANVAYEMLALAALSRR